MKLTTVKICSTVLSLLLACFVSNTVLAQNKNSQKNPESNESKKDTHGSVRVESDSTADVYIEGVFSGKTPLEVQSKNPATYRVVVKRGSYDDFVKDVEVSKGTQSLVKATWTAQATKAVLAIRSEDDFVGYDEKTK